MNDETKKKLLLASGFALVILFIIIYYTVVISDNGDSSEIAEFNPQFTSPELPNSTPFAEEYESKVDAYQKARDGGQTPDQKVEIPFYGESAIPDSLAFATPEDYQRYLIDSLQRELVKQSQPQEQITEPTPKPPQKERTANIQTTPKKEIVAEKESDRFKDYDFNRDTNPLASEETPEQERRTSNKYYNARFIENTIIIVGEDQTINLRNTEEIKLDNGKIIPRNTIMTGILTQSSNRLIIKINQVETFDGNVAARLSVYHADYKEGLPYQNPNDLSEENQKNAERAINAAGSRASVTIPFLNIPLSLAPKVGTNQKEKIYLPASMTFKLAPSK